MTVDIAVYTEGLQMTCAEGDEDDRIGVESDAERMLRLVRQHGVGEAWMWIHPQSAKALIVPVIFCGILTHNSTLFIIMENSPKTTETIEIEQA